MEIFKEEPWLISRDDAREVSHLLTYELVEQGFRELDALLL
jgi:hypothetical protein